MTTLARVMCPSSNISVFETSACILYVRIGIRVTGGAHGHATRLASHTRTRVVGPRGGVRSAVGVVD